MRSSFNFEHVQFSLQSPGRAEKNFFTPVIFLIGEIIVRWRRGRTSSPAIRAGHLSIWPEPGRSFHGLSHTETSPREIICKIAV